MGNHESKNEYEKRDFEAVDDIGEARERELDRIRKEGDEDRKRKYAEKINREISAKRHSLAPGENLRSDPDPVDEFREVQDDRGPFHKSTREQVYPLFRAGVHEPAVEPVFHMKAHVIPRKVRESGRCDGDRDDIGHGKLSRQSEIYRREEDCLAGEYKPDEYEDIWMEARCVEDALKI